MFLPRLIVRVQVSSPRSIQVQRTLFVPANAVGVNRWPWAWSLFAGPLALVIVHS